MTARERFGQRQGNEWIVAAMREKDRYVAVCGMAPAQQATPRREDRWTGQGCPQCGTEVAGRQTVRWRPPGRIPLSTTRRAGMPLAICSSTRARAIAADSRTPSSSVPRSSSDPAMSYHARIFMPPLTVIGRTGACGNTYRMSSRTRPAELRRNRLEVVPVRSETVQPHHGSGRGARRFDDDRGIELAELCGAQSRLSRTRRRESCRELRRAPSERPRPAPGRRANRRRAGGSGSTSRSALATLRRNRLADEFLDVGERVAESLAREADPHHPWRRHGRFGRLDGRNLRRPAADRS